MCVCVYIYTYICVCVCVYICVCVCIYIYIHTYIYIYILVSGKKICILCRTVRTEFQTGQGEGSIKVPPGIIVIVKGLHLQRQKQEFTGCFEE